MWKTKGTTKFSNVTFQKISLQNKSQLKSNQPNDFTNFFWPSRPQPLNLLSGDVEANVTSFRGAEQDILPVWRNTMDFLPLSWTSKDFHVFQRCKSNNGSKLSEILVWKGRPLLSSSPPVTMNPKVRNLTLSIVLLSFARIPEQRKRRRPLKVEFAKDGSPCVLRRGCEV